MLRKRRSPAVASAILSSLTPPIHRAAHGPTDRLARNNLIRLFRQEFTLMKKIEGIPVWGDPVDEGALAQIKNCARDATNVAMMADHHKGYAVPIGGVVAYEDK